MYIEYLEALKKIGINDSLKVSMMFISLIAPGYLGILVYSPDFYKEVSSISILFISLSISAPVYLFVIITYYFQIHLGKLDADLKELTREMEEVEQTFRKVKSNDFSKEQLLEERDVIELKMNKINSKLKSTEATVVNSLYEGAGIISGAYYPWLLIAYTFSIPLEIFIWIFIVLVSGVVYKDISDKKNG